MNTTPAKNSLRYLATLALLAVAVNPAVAQITWKNTDETYPPGATQNWNVNTNWNGDVVPSDTGAVMNLGSALINTAVPDITTFLIGNNADATATRSLYIDNGGSLNVTSTAAAAFRLFNTAGGHRVTVAAGGSLTVAGTLHNGATTGTGSSSIFNSVGTVSALALVTSKNAVTNITGGTVSISQAFNSITVSTGGVIQQSGGAVQANNTGSLLLGEAGTYRISGGSLSATNTSAGLYINGGAGTGSRTLHVNGSGASSIDFGGLRYLVAQDQASMVWKFTLDNGANHITKVNFVNNGNAGGSVRHGTLDVGLAGGVLLSGNSTLVLMEGPTISAATNFTNAADYTTGTAKLWEQSITDSTRDTLNVTLNTTVQKGSLDFSNPIALTFANSAYGYVSFTNTNLTQPFTLGLAISGGSLSNFTTALTAAGIDWSAGTGGYDVNLTMNPAVSGGTVFAWDLQSIDAAMGVDGIGVIPEPSSLLLVGLSGLAFLLRRFPRRKA